MYCDAHCHIFDLLEYIDKEQLNQILKDTACAISSFNLEQFLFHESLAKKAAEQNAAQATAQAEHPAPVVLCFAAHPQLPAMDKTGHYNEQQIKDTLVLLEKLAKEKRIHAIGEAGFDLYSEEYRNTEKIQDEVFNHHLDIALTYNLPMVFHVRRAMHKIFLHTGKLKKLPAVIFHSWSGTIGEGEALLRRGVNTFFSFGTAIVNNHKEAKRCCALFPQERLLFESDSPYMPLRGKTFSSMQDLPLIYKAAFDLQKEAGKDPGSLAYPKNSFEEFQIQCTSNFSRAFGVQLPVL